MVDTEKQIDGTIQTKSDLATQHDRTSSDAQLLGCFSTVTCIELLDSDKLTVNQLNHELVRYGVQPCDLESYGLKTTKVNALKAFMSVNLTTRLSETTETLTSLTDSFARCLQSQVQNLEKNIDEAQTLVSAL